MLQVLEQVADIDRVYEQAGVVGVRQLIDVGADAAYLFCQFFYFNYVGIGDVCVAVDQAVDRSKCGECNGIVAGGR